MRVRFRISDVFLPSAEELDHLLSADAETEGVIVDFSDSGSVHHFFAIVELDSGQAMVVPLQSLKPTRPGPLESGGP
jgi:hypothetical protein